MNNIKKNCFCCIVFMFALGSWALEIKNYDLEHFKNDKNEGFYYLLQLRKLYPLMWGADVDSLKKISYQRTRKDEIANCSYKFEEVERNGYIATKLKEAEKQGLFDILSKACDAPKQNFFNIWDLGGDDFKVICSLKMVHYLYTYKIWLSIKNKRWNLVAEDLKIWLHAGVLTREYAFYGPVLQYMFYLLQRQNMPRNTIREILELNKYVVDNPPVRGEKWANDTAILNIIVAELLLYKKRNLRFPEKLSQIKSLRNYLSKLTKKIVYNKSNAGTWVLKYKSEAIIQGKQKKPFHSFMTDRKKQYTDKDGTVSKTSVEKIERTIDGQKKILYKSIIITYDKDGKEIVNTKISDKNPDDESSRKPIVIIGYSEIMIIDKKGARTYKIKPEKIK